METIGLWPRLIIIIAILVALLSTQFILAYRIRSASNLRSSLTKLIGLTAVITFSWLFATLVIFYTCVDCFIGVSKLPFEEILFRNTLALPLTSNALLCAMLPETLRQSIINLCAIINLLLLPISLYALGLIAFVLAKYRATAQN
jgi:hypothetical protein